MELIVIKEVNGVYMNARADLGEGAGGVGRFMDASSSGIRPHAYPQCPPFGTF